MNIKQIIESQKLLIQFKESAGIDREHEPVSFGVPFPLGQIHSLNEFFLVDDACRPVETCFTILGHWHDKSIKWALCDMVVSVKAFQCLRIYLVNGKNPTIGCHLSPVKLSISGDKIHLNTGQTDFEIDVSKNMFLFYRVSYNFRQILGPNNTPLIIKDHCGVCLDPIIHSWEMEHDTPLRKVLCLKGRLRGGKKGVNFSYRVHFYSNKSYVKIDFSIVNNRPAFHPEGAWDLGDKNSFVFKELKIDFQFKPSSIPRYFYTKNIKSPSQLSFGQSDICVYQESSGGENWKSKNHVNIQKTIPISFQGFQVIIDGNRVETGKRASPLVGIQDESVRIFACVENFWQNFPKALSTEKQGLSIQLFPGYFPDLFELQPGEQKKHSFYFGMDENSGPKIPLRWICAPLQAKISSQRYQDCLLGPKPISNPVSHNFDQMALYDSLVENVIKGEHSFKQKNEQMDEYGWRNFGDVFADHESFFSTHPSEFISHYNNQYDVVKGAIFQFMRSGSQDWFDLAKQMADHVYDIDMYHTSGDKSQFNKGMFWHTDHHLNAFTSSHRTISRAHKRLKPTGSFGGGPAPDHNYATGFLYLYWITGDIRYKKAVICLADNIIGCINSPETLCEFLLQSIRLFLKNRGQGRTTPSTNYENIYRYDGPGRASGNSLNTLLDAWLLTSETGYVNRAETLIYRCISPEDDFEEMDLLNAELRWMYTVFLQALARYLEIKKSMEIYDGAFHYARNSFIQYSKWMADNERPYLDIPDALEFPNETWAAQEIRKADIFALAVTYAPAGLRSLFEAKSKFFFEQCLSRLNGFDTRYFTRPLAILMTNGMPAMELMQKGRPKIDPPPFEVSGRGENSSSFLAQLFKKCLSFSLTKEVNWLKIQFRSRIVK